MAVVVHEDDRKFHDDLEASRNSLIKMEMFYNNWSEKYDDILKHSLLDVNKHAAEMLAKHIVCKETGVVLDVAYGTGFTGLAVDRAGIQLIDPVDTRRRLSTGDGVDMSDGMLQEAKKKGVFQHLSKGMITELLRLNRNDETYDGVICAGAISAGHLNLYYALKELARVSKRNAILVYTCNAKLKVVEFLDTHKKFLSTSILELVIMEKGYYYRVNVEEVKCYFCV